MKPARVVFTTLVLVTLAATAARSADQVRLVQPLAIVFTDERDRPVGVGVWTDPATGCDYLISSGPGGDIQPRLQDDGLPLCRRP